MKTHKLAACFDLASKILRQLPDGEITDVLENLLELVRKSKQPEESESRMAAAETAAPLSQVTMDTIMAMSPAEAERFLASSEEFASTVRLRELVERLGIAQPRRQSHAALVNMVVKYVESRSMDSIIRSGRASSDDPGTTKKE